MNTETMRILVAKGLGAADILEISETLDAPAERSKAAERQARYRARIRGGDVTGDVTRHGDSDVTPPALSRPPNEENLTPPPIPTQIKKPAHVRGHRLPEDWQPEALTGASAQEVAAWPVGAIERELSRFRDWAASATGPNAIKSNWQAAWRNWLKRAQDDGRYGKTPQQRNGFSGQGRTRDIGLEVAAELAARRERSPGPADNLPRIGPPGRVYG